MSSNAAADGHDAESHFAALVKCDIVNSTDVQRSVSRPDAAALRREFHNTVRAVAASFDPDVRIEEEGDGALVAFGYRLDAAELAVRTGLKLIDAVRAIALVPKVHLEIRVGIAAGPVTIYVQRGSFGGDLSIVRADRLMKAAQPGQVVLADDTKRLAGDFFTYEDLGVVPLKGLDDMRAWRVVGETGVASRFAAQRHAGPRRAIVGRDDALAQLARAWTSAVEGHGSAVCLVGDAGMGKSRLAKHALEKAARDGARVLEIDCTPNTGNSPLLPIGVLLRRMAHIGAGASDIDKEHAGKVLIGRVLGEDGARDALQHLAPLFGIESAVIPLDKTPEQVRALMIATIVALVRGLSAQAPLVLLCEDLHWADDSTAQVIEKLAEIIGQCRAMMIVTRWPRAVTPIDADRVTAAFTTIPIEPLASANAVDLVRTLADGALSSARVEAIVNRCGGVPLLLEEITRNTLEHSDPDATVRAGSVATGSVPAELQLVVESRLRRWPEFKPVVEAASVLGREFPIALLADVVPDRRADVPGAIAHFAEHGLFAAVDPASDRASFRRALIRDAVYDTVISSEYLKSLHARAADTLMAKYDGTPDASPDVLARHLRIADRLEEAIRIRLIAGEDTFKRGAYVEATGHCDAAGELIDEVRDRTKVRSDAFRLNVLRGMVGAGVHGYSADPVELSYRQAREMFEEATSAEMRYPVIRGLATASLVRGDLATAHRYSLDAITLAEQSARSDYRIDAMSVVAYTTFYFDRLETCRSWIGRCLALYEVEGGDTFRYPVPQDAKTAALALLPTVAWLLGDPEGSEKAIERGLLHVEQLGRDFDKALLHAWIAGTRYTQRRYLEAVQHAGLAYAIGMEHKFQEWLGVGGMMALLCQSVLQPAAATVAQAIEGAQAFKARGVGLNASYFLWGIACGLRLAGNPDGAKAMLDFALQAAAESQETRMKPEIWILQAEIETDPASAARLLREAYDLAGTQGAVANALRAGAAWISRTSSDAAQIERAQATLTRLNGGGAEGAGANWMQEDLAYVRQVLGAAS